MALDPQAIADELEVLLQPDARGRLLARGLARGMVWRDGELPPGSAGYSEELTEDLLDYGYGLLAMALELRDANRDPLRSDNPFATQDAFRVAAEAIESCMRRGPANAARGLHLVVSAAAFHLAGYAARSFTLLHGEQDLNLSSMEVAVSLLLQRSLFELRSHVLLWLSAEEHSDTRVAEQLQAGDDWDLEELVFMALARPFLRAVGLADTALFHGDQEAFSSAREALEHVADHAALASNVPAWWAATLTRHLLDDLWDESLHARLPKDPPKGGNWAELRRSFIDLLSVRRPPQIDLWPSQLDAAARATDPEDNLVVSLPTSAGKTRIAELCILRALAGGRRTVYVTPLRALSAQVEQTLAKTFVPLGASVTSLYGASGVTPSDAKNLADADVVVATPEKLDFAVRQDPAVLDSVGLVVFDEGHMIGLGSREIRYEVLIQRLLRRKDAGERRIVCLSAMFNAEDPSFADFHCWLRRDQPGEPIHVDWRPTRQAVAFLDWYEKSGHAKLQLIEGEKPYVPRFVERRPAKKPRRKGVPNTEREFCVAAANAFALEGHSVLVYSPQRSLVEPAVSDFVKLGRQGYLDGTTRPNPRVLARAQAIGREWLGEDHPAVEALPLGVGTHHAALPRPFQAEIERLLADKSLSVVVASPTLAQGMDLSCSVLLFRSIGRFEARTGKQETIPADEFANVIGRVGRAYVDLDGLAVYPVYKSHAHRHRAFNRLLRESKEQVLWSGLVRLIHKLAGVLMGRLGIQESGLLEYVLNQQTLWEDQRLAEASGTEKLAEEEQKELEEKLADLDVAIFALIDPLSAAEQDLAGLLDTALQGSLWDRTLRRAEDFRDLGRALLDSRAKWLWRVTSESQRSACFASGLGHASGVFLYERLDSLVAELAAMHEAVADQRASDVVAPALRFAEVVMEDAFFSVNLPAAWRVGLTKWVSGTAFAEIIEEDSKLQPFIQDGVVFRLVWAAEAVRVQAATTEHPRADELGEGPALVLTHGVPTIQAALLCQAGLASRTASVHATQQRPSDFTDFSGLWQWVNDNADDLYDSAFWATEDQFLLWRSVESGPTGERSREWERREISAQPKWEAKEPERGTRVRLIPEFGRSAFVCSEHLDLLGRVEFEEDLSETHLTGQVAGKGHIKVSCFGPAKRDS